MKKWIVFICVMGFFTVLDAAPAKGTGTLKDLRDGKSYKTVKIGSQTWMAENLNLHMEDSWCYERKTENCKKYGRLYTWKKAVKACPEGWHLPSRKEWREMISYASKNSKDKIGNALRTKDDWKTKKRKKKIYDRHTGEPFFLDEYEIVNTGTNEFGFSALPAGYVSNTGHFVKIKENAVFWTSTREPGKKIKMAYNRQLEFGNDAVYESKNSTGNAFSVRCVKDSE